jgi:hypothetical protein
VRNVVSAAANASRHIGVKSVARGVPSSVLNWRKGCPYNYVPLVSTDILCHPFNYIKSKSYAAYYSAIIHGHFLAFAEILVCREAAC